MLLFKPRIMFAKKRKAKKKHRHKKKRFHGVAKNIAIFSLSAFFIFSGVFVLWAVSLDIPDFEYLTNRKITESTKIYDRTGEVVLYDVHRDIKRTVVPLDDISLYARNATIAIEDDEFYSHKGIKPMAILRAVFVNLTKGEYVQGGSTITQQVIKNTLLTREKKISRKLKEWILAIKLEQQMSKEKILELYLNEAPYGGNIYGIEEASRTFFGKSAKELTLAESAYLASLPQAPTRYSPYGNNRDLLEQRKNLVLERMRKLGFITDEEYAKAKNEKVVFLPRDPYGIKAPHFITWVKEYLVQKYGEKIVEEGGLRVITTLDYELQKKAEEIVKKYGEMNKEKFNASNAAMVGVDPKTGQILVMVGSVDYFDKENEGNFNVALAKRQPGSAFKPFVYATAFMKGYTPETVVFDLKTQFQTTCDSEGKPLYSEVDPRDCYIPKNYDNKYRGPITLREALAQSINVPAIKTLYLAGLNDSLETAKKMGITTLDNANVYGLTLVLGGGEVKLLDITSAYGVFANNGIRNPYTPILKVEDRDGNILEEYTPKPTRVIPKKVALQISDILSDNTARAPAFGVNNPLRFEGRDVAVKTGTTNDYRDAWTVGYTPSFALGAWVGNNDNSSMKKKVAGYIVTPMWHEMMQEVLNKTPDEKFENIASEKDNRDLKPVLRGIWQGGRRYFIDSISGKRATQYTPEETKKEQTIKEVHNILYWVDKNNPRGPIPQKPEKDPQFSLWEEPVRKWVEKYNIAEDTDTQPIKEYDDIHIPENFPIVSIESPQKGVILSVNKKIPVIIKNTGKFPTAKVELFINDRYIASSKKPPFIISFIPSQIEGIQKKNKLKVVVYDSVFNKTEQTTTFFVQ